MKLGDSKEVLYICGLSRLEIYIGDSGISPLFTSSLATRESWHTLLSLFSSGPLLQAATLGAWAYTLSESNLQALSMPWEHLSQQVGSLSPQRLSTLDWEWPQATDLTMRETLLQGHGGVGTSKGSFQGSFFSGSAWGIVPISHMPASAQSKPLACIILTWMIHPSGIYKGITCHLWASLSRS